MPDQRFFDTAEPLGPKDVERIGAVDIRAGDGLAIARVAMLGAASLERAVIFIENEAAIAEFSQRPDRGSGVGLVLTTQALAESLPNDIALGLCDAPRVAFARLARALHHSKWDDSPTVLRKQSSWAHAFVAEGANVHDEAVIAPGAVIGPGVEIGPGVRVGSNAVVTHATIGAGALIGAGVVIGGVGFGIVEDGGLPVAMPHLGIVEIGARVDIGANTTIDRATLCATRIGDDTKIDNQVQIGHNVHIGRSCLIAAQVGIAGSATLGDGVIIGGQSGISDHISIGDGARLGAASGFMRHVPAGESWGGTPAQPTHLWWRSILFTQRGGRQNLKSDHDN